MECNSSDKKYRLSQKDIEAIEKPLNQRGAKRAEVGVESGKIVVLEVEKKVVAV